MSRRSRDNDRRDREDREEAERQIKKGNFYSAQKIIESLPIGKFQPDNEELLKKIKQ